MRSMTQDRSPLLLLMQIKGLYRLFVEKDCTMVEVNPLAETDEALVAADAKLGFDDNAAFRQARLQIWIRPERCSVCRP